MHFVVGWFRRTSIRAHSTVTLSFQSSLDFIERLNTDFSLRRELSVDDNDIERLNIDFSLRRNLLMVMTLKGSVQNFSVRHELSVDHNHIERLSARVLTAPRTVY